MKEATLQESRDEAVLPNVPQAELDRLVEEATKFETLVNRPLLVAHLTSGRIVYASQMLDRYLGFSHQDFKAKGGRQWAAKQFISKEEEDWMMQVEHWRQEFFLRCQANAALEPSPYYTYDLNADNPATGLSHKIVVRSTCLRLSEHGQLFLATTFVDVSALKRGHKMFFHVDAPWGTETRWKDLEQGEICVEKQLLTEADAELVRLLRVLPARDAAQRLGLKPGTVQAKLKALCRKTDAVGLHGLVQVCNAMGWC